MKVHGCGHQKICRAMPKCSLSFKTTVENPYPVVPEPSAIVRFETVQIDILEFHTVSDKHCLEYRNVLNIIDMTKIYPVAIQTAFNLFDKAVGSRSLVPLTASSQIINLPSSPYLLFSTMSSELLSNSPLLITHVVMGKSNAFIDLFANA